MTNIAELKKRVEDAGDHFGRMAEQQRSNGQRVARLLEQVEKELSRKRAEIARLGGALSASEEEKGQLRDLLTSLLEAAEANGPAKDMAGAAGGDSVSDFESRIGALLSERELARSDAAYYLGADEDDEDDADADLDAERDDAKTPAGDTRDSSADETAPDRARAAAPDGPPQGASPGSSQALPQDLPPAEAADDADPSPEDLGAVNRIMQRISLLTGDFVDHGEPADRPESASNFGRPAIKTG